MGWSEDGEEDREVGTGPESDFPLDPPTLEESVPAGERLPAGLYVVGTPIGNMADITLRALDTLKGVQAVLTEDTRHTGMLLTRYGFRKPLVSCHKFNEASRVEAVVTRILGGQALALVTNAGMPAVSDPGSRLVMGCRKAGCPVTVIPGPSAATTAIAASGLGWGGGFLFEGFLPRKSGARRKRLEILAAGDLPVVLYESPYRLMALLEELAEVLGPERLLFVGRELTKKFEETRTGTAAEMIAVYKGRTIKGELTLVLSPRV
ncbi:MAG: 16S rRNA (cytidine(1402)-2'-O)-methyltransferase [Kiritimatiellia bacterium]